MEFYYRTIQAPPSENDHHYTGLIKTIPADVVSELHTHLQSFDESSLRHAGTLMDALLSFRYTRDGKKDQRLLIHHLEPVFRYVIWNGLWSPF